MRAGIIAAITAVAIALGLGVLLTNWDPEQSQTSAITENTPQTGRAATPTPPPGETTPSPAQTAVPKAD